MIVIAVLAYLVGEHDGRIAECRMKWTTVEQATDIWSGCKARLGVAFLSK